MSTTEKHQGYTNYATFGVAVTLDNNRPWAERIHAITFAAIDNAPTDENVSGNIWTVEETERFRLSDAIRDYVENLCESGIRSVSDAGLMASQMVQAGLCEVDWQDLARTYLDLAKTEWER
jgi:hypothetical protein